MNFLKDNYDYHKEAEEIRKKQNKVFSKDNQTYILEKHKKIQKEIEALLTI